MTAIEQQVVDVLAKGPLTAKELMRETGWSDSVVYTSLVRLRQVGLVVIAQPQRRGSIWNGAGRRSTVFQLAEPL